MKRIINWPKRVKTAKQAVIDLDLSDDLDLALDSLIDACRQEWSHPRDLLDPDIPPVERAERVAQQLSHSADKEDHVLAAVINVLIAIANHLRPRDSLEQAIKEGPVGPEGYKTEPL